ncbi:DUF4407 domain-containing protein [Pyxidicoccus sp. 3LG]
MTAGVRLFVQQPRAMRRHPLDRLVRLDVWGHTLLGDRVAAEMGAAYLLLAVVFIFEVSAWSLLFNYVFQDASFETDRWTFVAMGLGLLWGGGIFVIDKGLITTDLRQPGLSKWLGFVARVILIGASALLTAEPLEQLVFNARIEERLKEEIVLEEAVTYAERLKRVQAKAEEIRVQPAEDEVPQFIKDRRAAAEAARVAAREKAALAGLAITQKQQKLSAAESLRGKLRDELEVLQSDSTAPMQAEEARARYERQVANVEAAKQELARAQTEAQVANVRRATAQLESDDAHRAHQDAIDDGKGRRDADADRFDARGAEMQRFIDEMRRANYLEKIQTPGGGELRWRRAGFITRAQVLDLLVQGRPARWPTAASEEQKKEAIKVMGLPMSSTSNADAERSVFRSWLMLLLISMAIPSLALFFKFTMSEEMRNYYSVQCQEQAGNPEAVLHQRVLSRSRW